ncbi:hypothetical protein BLNAU_10593 [Blattamonas nauphoetae]|uniref:Uncharacterized protein n=1 Tax=Blattamonas nauphoetae TaxID=2049346 RepID=A0ABQ9XRR8_9EUKA|nr:hypothetical protein BLNAU_10593 [Blattamonas nauphoetae]
MFKKSYQAETADGCIIDSSIFLSIFSTSSVLCCFVKSLVSFFFFSISSYNFIRANLVQLVLVQQPLLLVLL